MDLRMPDAIAAIFPTNRDARTCADRLERAGFAAPWTARTEPASSAGAGTDEELAEKPKADGSAAPAKPAKPVAYNDVTQSSDGVLGTIGRFFSGEGNSLRRSLEDHGIDPDDAAAIDATIATAAVVLVVDAGGRRDEAAAILRAHAGRIARATPPVDAALESDAGTAAFHATTDPDVVAARPEAALADVSAADVAALERDEDLAEMRAAQPQRFYERRSMPPGRETDAGA